MFFDRIATNLIQPGAASADDPTTRLDQSALPATEPSECARETLVALATVLYTATTPLSSMPAVVPSRTSAAS
jgi:hypothetical protein